MKRWSAFVGCRITAGYKVLIHSLIHQSYNTPVDQNVHEAWLQNMRSSILLLATNVVLLSPGNYQLKLKMQSGVTLSKRSNSRRYSVLCFCCIVQWGIKCNKLNFLSWDFTRKKTSTKLRMYKVYQQLAKQIYSTIVIVSCSLKARRLPNSRIVRKCTTASCYLVQHSIFMTNNFSYIYTLQSLTFILIIFARQLEFLHENHPSFFNYWKSTGFFRWRVSTQTTLSHV